MLSFGASDENGEGKEHTFDTSKAEKPLIVALGVGMGDSVHNAKVYYLDLMDLPLQPTSGPLSKYSGCLEQNSSGAYTSVIQNRSIVAPPYGSMVLRRNIVAPRKVAPRKVAPRHRSVVLPPANVVLPPKQAKIAAQLSLPAQNAIPAQDAIQPQPVLNQINRADGLL